MYVPGGVSKQLVSPSYGPANLNRAPRTGPRLVWTNPSPPSRGVSAPAGHRMGKVLGMAALQAALGMAAMSMLGKVQRMRLQSRPWMGGDASGMWVPGKEFTWDLHPEPFEWIVGQWVGTATDAAWLPRLAPFGDPRFGHYWFTPDFVPDVFNPPFGWWQRGWVVPNSDSQVGQNWNSGVIIVPDGDPLPVPEPLPYPGYKRQEVMAYDPEPVIDPQFDTAIVPGPKGPVVKNIPPTRPPRGFKPDTKYKSPALALKLLGLAGMASEFADFWDAIIHATDYRFRGPRDFWKELDWFLGGGYQSLRMTDAAKNFVMNEVADRFGAYVGRKFRPLSKRFRPTGPRFGFLTGPAM